MVIREFKTQLLLADLPTIAIHQIQQLSNDLFKIIFKNNKKIAIKICSNPFVDTFIKNVKKYKIDFKVFGDEATLSLNNTVDFPDLNDLTIQNFILKLIYSDKFQNFVKDFSSLYDEINKKIEPENAVKSSESESENESDYDYFLEDYEQYKNNKKKRKKSKIFLETSALTSEYQNNNLNQSQLTLSNCNNNEYYTATMPTPISETQRDSEYIHNEDRLDTNIRNRNYIDRYN